MEIVRYVIYAEERVNETIRIVPFGDFHVGNINCDKEKLEEVAKWIASTPKTFWIGMGDYLDSIIPFDESRFDEKTIDPDFTVWKTDGKRKWRETSIDAAYNYIYNLLKPIRNKCIGLHAGNHEEELRRRTGHDYVTQLCRELEVNYLGIQAYIWLSFEKGRSKSPGTAKFTILSQHGSYGGDEMGGAINRLSKVARQWEADIYLMGHTHFVHGWRDVYKALERVRGKLFLSERKKVYALTGGFLKAYKEGTTSYLEKKGKLERKTGIVSIIINPVRRDIHVME
ncbi:MAG: hypothetical protein QW334_00215 [Thermofilum sp.]